MPTKGYIGDDNGVAQVVTKLYIGDDNGIAQEVVKAYIGDENGIAQLCYIKAKAQVTLTGLSNQHYCVIGGTTYDNGDYTLEMEIGTPIFIHFKVTQGSSLRVLLNTDDNGAAYCEKYRYVVTGDVTIACSSEFPPHMVVGDTIKRAIITEAVPTSSDFVHKTTYSTGEIENYGFSCRSGMTWGQFIGSMYDDGYFGYNSRGEVTYHSGWVLFPTDPANNIGRAVYADDRIYSITYL